MGAVYFVVGLVLSSILNFGGGQLLGGGTGTINQLQQFVSTTSPSSAITQAVYGKTLRFTGLESLDCLGTDSSGIVGAGTCSGGGGSSAYEIATTSSIAVPDLAYFTKTSGRTTIGSVATSTLSASSPLALTGTTVIVGPARTISIDTTGTWTGNAGTATALAADGSNCSAGSYPLGVDASGNSQSCTVAAVGTVTAVSVASANGFTGSSSGGATPQLTLTTSISGVLKGNGTAISAAANGTDYTLISANTCSAGNHVSAITAAGVITCSADSGSGTSAFEIATTSDIALSQLTYISQVSGRTTLASVATGTISSANSALSVTANRYAVGGALSLTVATTGTSMFTGTAGQVLAFINGGWTGVATTTAGTGLTFSGGAFNVNASQNITTLSNLTTNGLVTTSGSNGTLGVTVNGTAGFVLAMSGGIPTWVSTSSINNGVTALGGVGQQLTGSLILATSSTAYNGLTASTTITCVTLTCTFANTLAGILGVPGGGTGAATLTGLISGNGTSAFTATANGTNGQVLAMSGGVPTWLATSTLSTITGTLTVGKGGTGLTTFGGTNTILYTTAADTLASEVAFTYDSSTNKLTTDYASTTAITASGSASTTALVVSGLNAANCDVKSSTTGVLSCGTDSTGAGGSNMSSSTATIIMSVIGTTYYAYNATTTVTTSNSNFATLLQAQVNLMDDGAQGGSIYLTQGTYYSSATTTINGNNAGGGNDSGSVEIWGAGQDATKIVLNGNSDWLDFDVSAMPKVHDVSVYIKGGSNAFVSDSTSNNVRAMWNFEFANVEIVATTTTTGYGFNLGNAFRGQFNNIEMFGLHNCAKFNAEGTFNPGDFTWSRSFCELDSASGAIAYQFTRASTGFMNQVHFDVAEGIAVGTGATFISGVDLAYSQFTGLNAEQFDTLVSLDGVTDVAAGNYFQFNYATPRALTAGLSGCVFTSDAEGNTCEFKFFNTTASTVIVNDANVNTANPNIIMGFIGSDTGTASATIGGSTVTIFRDISGYGTIDTTLKPDSNFGTWQFWGTLITKGATAAVNFANAVFLTIPTGTAPVVNHIGDIAFDTTAAQRGQLLVATSTSASAPAVFNVEQKIWGMTIASTSVDFVSGGRLPLPPLNSGWTITRIVCVVDAGTSVVVNVDSLAGGVNTDTATCATTKTVQAVSTNSLIASTTPAAIELGTITGAVDYVSFSVWGTPTRE